MGRQDFLILDFEVTAEGRVGSGRQDRVWGGRLGRGGEEGKEERSKEASLE